MRVRVRGRVRVRVGVRVKARVSGRSGVGLALGSGSGSEIGLHVPSGDHRTKPTGCGTCVSESSRTAVSFSDHTIAVPSAQPMAWGWGWGQG